MFKLSSNALQLSASFLCLLTLAGCGQQAEPQPVKEQITANQSQNEALDLSQMCDKLKSGMMQINDQRTTFALEQINQDLKVCLPLLNLEQQKEMLRLSTLMYKNFLHVERTPAQQLAFEKYAFDMAQHPTIHQSHFAQLALRDQYLLKHKGQAYVELVDTGAEKLDYRRSPEYLGRIFAPYMPEAESVFIENLAHQNTEGVLLDGALTIEPFEIARRALFWEDYIQRYPRSSYLQDAKNLSAHYQRLLFIGSKASPVSDSYTDKYSVSVSSWEEIAKLAQSDNSALSKQAQKFLNFYLMTNAERSKTLGAQQNQSPEQILTAYLGIPKITNNKDCFSDAICI
ncbi:hypothetical protein [Acinetobacter tianfuensis]|uniref:hypothetical protein n=1 Tax=Acinetobacter tianfuensis TaxID=2419603 RepID=UPI001D17EEA0|nr:hypothetical protein [Acinetobacter tianfuensis]